MAIDVQWDVNNRLRYVFSGRWDWQGLQAAAQEADALAGTRTGTVDVIFDLTACGLLAFTSLPVVYRQTTLPLPRNSDTLLLVGSGPVASAARAILCRAFPEIREMYHAAHTLREAHALLNGRARKRSVASVI